MQSWENYGRSNQNKYNFQASLFRDSIAKEIMHSTIAPVFSGWKYSVLIILCGKLRKSINYCLWQTHCNCSFTQRRMINILSRDGQVNKNSQLSPFTKSSEVLERIIGCAYFDWNGLKEWEIQMIWIIIFSYLTFTTQYSKIMSSSELNQPLSGSLL